MSETIVRERGQIELPIDVLEAAGIKENDLVDWRFENGAIVGRKTGTVEVEVLDLEDVDPVTFLPKDGGMITKESILQAIQADRDSR